jgi:hypothetical protein
MPLSKVLDAVQRLNNTYTVSDVGFCYRLLAKDGG